MKRYKFVYLLTYLIQVFAIAWHPCTSWPWSTFSRSRILKCEYLENGESQWKILNYNFCRGWHLPSNETIANVVFHVHDLTTTVKVETFQVAIIYDSKRLEKSNITIVIRSCICNRIAPLWMLYIITLTYIFKITKSELWISWKFRASKKMLYYDFCRSWYSLGFRIIFKCCILWTWNKFSKSRIWNVIF